MHWKEDLSSKLMDGLLAGVILYFLLVFMVILVRPIQASVGRPGLLIYTLSLIALSVFCLEHSLLPRISESQRAWYGMAGGVVAWTSISLANDLGVSGITSVTGTLLLILVSLTVTRLWRKYLPLGGRFYSLTVLLSWVGQLILNSRTALVSWNLHLNQVYIGLGYTAILGGFLTIWWIFTQTNKRIQRLALAPALSFFVVISAYILR